MKKSAKTPFFTVNLEKWPVVVIHFNRDLSKERNEEEEDIKLWIDLLTKKLELAKERKSKLIVIYDHTIFNFPSTAFRIRSMKFIQDNFETMDKLLALTIMIMPSMMTRMVLKAATAISRIPGSMKIVADMEQAQIETDKYLKENNLTISQQQAMMA